MYEKAVLHAKTPVVGIELFQQFISNDAKNPGHLVKGERIQQGFIGA